MWEAVEANTREVRIGETQGRRGKEGKEEEEETEKRKTVEVRKVVEE